MNFIKNKKSFNQTFLFLWVLKIGSFDLSDRENFNPQQDDILFRHEKFLGRGI